MNNPFSPIDTAAAVTQNPPSQKAEVKPANLAAMPKSLGPKGDPDSPNYKKTSDPNVVMGKYGVPITRKEFEKANKNGMGWQNFESYADYVGSWAKPVSDPNVLPKQMLPPPPPKPNLDPASNKRMGQYEGYHQPGSGYMRYHQ